ncbi:MAG: M20/M25/M40 family metallo-hydrolase, partial [Gammaproteobacteria bacterium]|nr:M20/M25/M40 family metallo-hydrolase [Gammaproteobacteria bacterium]
MSARIDKVLRHLRALVAFDTQNPPRQIDPSGLFSYLTDQLDGFECQLDDLGDGCINLLAVRGQPRILFNFHIDTVPASAQWESDPLRLQVENGRATGLGACDIKGAAACMLAAVADSPGDVALLFSSDEEAGKSRCIHHFLEHAPEFDGVVVAEPTRAQAVLAHRGIASGRLQFTGHAGHASDSRAMTDSAIHRAVRWA